MNQLSLIIIAGVTGSLSVTTFAQDATTTNGPTEMVVSSGPALTNTGRQIDAKLAKQSALLQKLAASVSEKAAKNSTQVYQIQAQLRLLNSTTTSNRITLSNRLSQAQSASTNLIGVKTEVRRSMSGVRAGGEAMRRIQEGNRKRNEAQRELDQKAKQLVEAQKEVIDNELEAGKLQLLIAEASAAQEQNIFQLALAVQTLKAAGKSEEAAALQRKIDAVIVNIPEGALEKGVLEGMIAARDAAANVVEKLEQLSRDNRAKDTYIARVSQDRDKWRQESEEWKQKKENGDKEIIAVAQELGLKTTVNEKGNVGIDFDAFQAFLDAKKANEEALKNIAVNLGITNNASAQVVVATVKEKVSTLEQKNTELSNELVAQARRFKEKQRLLAERDQLKKVKPSSEVARAIQSRGYAVPERQGVEEVPEGANALINTDTSTNAAPAK